MRSIAIVSLAFWLTGGRYVGTDDSYVHAAQLMVSTDVSGLVTDVDVHQGQNVKAGQVLFRIDPRQFQIALDNAKANLGQDAADAAFDERRLHAHAERYRRAGSRRSRSTRSPSTAMRRCQRLNSIAQAQDDQAHFTLRDRRSTLASLKEQAQVQLAKLGGNIDTPDRTTAAISRGAVAGR